MTKGQKKPSSWMSCFGGIFARVEDVPSPRASPKGGSPAKQNNKQSQKQQPNNKPKSAQDVAKLPSFTRLSYTDLSNSTLFTSTEYLSSLSSSLVGANLHIFTLAELKAATAGFSQGNFLGEGGFGPVYKGFIEDKLRTGLKAQTIAVKLLDLDGMQGHKEWLTEVILLGQLRHPHLVKLIGYCYEEKHRVLVYEFMARGSLENHLFNNRFFPSLSWEKRIKIAYGAAKGLAFLHGVDQPVIYRDFKASNILLDSEFKAKLSDFGLAKDGPQGDDTHVSTRVMGTRGYAAPEYIMTGHLTAKSDVYSFGVVLLELLTGRRSVDKSKPSREQNLVEWARGSLNDQRKLHKIMDHGLEGQYSLTGAQKAAALAYQCLSHLPKSRPHMSTVVEILEPLLNCDDVPAATFVYTVRDNNDNKPSASPARKDGAIEAEKNQQMRSPQRNNEDGNADKQQQQPTTPKDQDGQQQQQHRHHHHRHHDATKAGREHRHHRHHRQHNNPNVRSPKQASYTDTALYRKSPRHRGGA